MTLLAYLQVYLDQPGWTVRQDLSTFQHDNYGHLVPEVKRAVMRVKEQAGVDLDCARAMAAAGIDDAEMVSVLMAGMGHTASPHFGYPAHRVDLQAASDAEMSDCQQGRGSNRPHKPLLPACVRSVPARQLPSACRPLTSTLPFPFSPPPPGHFHPPARGQGRERGSCHPPSSFGRGLHEAAARHRLVHLEEAQGGFAGQLWRYESLRSILMRNRLWR